jgi:hypothetical protein
MKTILISVFIILTTLSFGQNPDRFEPFNRSDYPEEKFQIISDSIRFKDFVIEIRQVRNKSGYNPFSCRAWLTISNKSKSIYQRFFKSIDAVGSCYGLFIPFKQPRQDYFILSKLGDYDGRIFIIDSNGNVIEKPGGPFSVSDDKRYLFSDYYSDESGLTVFDFIKGHCLFSGTITPRLFKWYYKDHKYISRVDLLNNKISPDEYYYFDLTTNKLIFFKQKKDFLKPEDELQGYNDNNSRRFCNCGFELLPRPK